MRRRIGSLVLAVLFLGLASTALVSPAPALAAQDEPDHMPGTIEGTGTHFELTDSDYLNLTVDSSEPISVVLESVPEVVAMHIEAACDAASTEIALGGFAPDTTYYMYEDDFDNETAFTADANGGYAYTQDLSAPHLVIVQPTPSTKIIRDDATGGDASSIGIWDPVSKTCTLTMDLSETIQIVSNGITLDGDGHTLSGTGIGVYVNGRSGVTVKNLTVSGFGFGIYLYACSGCTLSGNTVNSSSFAIYLRSSSDNVVSGNTVGSSTNGIMLGYTSVNNALTGNTVSGNLYGFHLRDAGGTDFTGNTAANNTQAGVYAEWCGGSSFTDSEVSDNHLGIWLYYSSDTTYTGNTISSNNYGFISYYPTNDAVYNNNFIGNVMQQARLGSAVGTVFNLPAPTGGNYWSDWTSPDSDGDGFVDTPYVFEGGQDNLPWTVPNGWVPSGNTMPGTDVTVALGSGVTVNFAEVIAAGDTTLTTSSTPPHGPPSGFRFLGTYYDIATTAGYLPPITISITYDPASIPGNREGKLRIFHSDGSAWQDVTVALDTVNHIITAQVFGLSWFGIAWQEYTFLGFLPPVAERDKPFKRGSTIPIKFRICEADGALVTDAVATLAIHYLEDSAPPGQGEVVSTAAGDWGNQFRYSADEDLYVFNLSTKHPSFFDYFTYEAEVTLDDGSTHSAAFSLK